MSTTLTNGLKLPDKGSVDWYADMQNNYTILDNSVGTIAEHSTQIAGKAPLVHTHTKSDITDFPVYGTTAGTICEGNDSRLSDARTPVAHTHTKSDVTDLLNSDFIPSANNSYNLGSSSYQWNNLYAKGYYYNGVAWGLDQGNTWTEANSFYESIQIHGGRNAYIMPEFGASYSGLTFGTVEFKQSFKFGDWVDNNSTIRLNTSNAYVEIYAGLDSSDNVNKAILNPSPNATTAELGTATAKWKTLNGVEPSSLSLPSGDASNFIDISSYFSNTGSGDINSYTASANGWIYLRLGNISSCQVVLNDSSNRRLWGTSATGNVEQIIVPILKNTILTTAWVTNSTVNVATARFIPCQGNV